MIEQIDKYWEKSFTDPIEVETYDGRNTFNRKEQIILLSSIFET